MNKREEYKQMLATILALICAFSILTLNCALSCNEENKPASELVTQTDVK